MPHDGGVLLQEVLAQGRPLDGALGHDPVGLAEIQPVFQRAHAAGRIEIGLVAGPVHQDLVVLHGERAEHPVGIAGRGDHDAPALDPAGGVLLDQLFAHGRKLVPGRRRLVRIEPGVAEGVLVVVHDDGRALERDAPGLAAGLTVLHQGRVELVQPGSLLVGLDDVVEGDDGVLLDQLVDVDREHDRELGRLAGLQRGQGLDAGVVVVARVDRLDLDVGVLLHEVGDQPVDDLGQRPADGHRIVHGKLDLGPGPAGETERERAGQQGPGQGPFQAIKHGNPPPSLVAEHPSHGVLPFFQPRALGAARGT